MVCVVKSEEKVQSKVNDELQIILEHMTSSGLENEYIKATAALLGRFRRPRCGSN
jgi:hypothetical protein